MDKRKITAVQPSSRKAPTRRSVANAHRAQSPSASSPAALKTAKPAGKTAAYVLAAVLAIILVALGVYMLSCAKADKPGDTTVTESRRVSLMAVGDNLPETVLGSYAQSLAEDGYDYTPLYEFIAPYAQAADLAYIKEEVHLDDRIGVHGYPSFNAPESLADDIVSTGFNVVASASNHCYDWGYYGACARNRAIWNTKNVLFMGTNLTEEEANTIAVVEKNNIRFAFLDYTYGVNGYDSDDLEWYEVNFISKDRIESDVTRAHELADVVIVAMHWGTENQTTPDDMQLEYAQFLADLDVDLVLGSHPHVIGAVDWLSGTSGHQTLVAYSLGNFISHHAYPSAYNELEAMLTCDFVRDNSGIHIENATIVPLVNHTDDESGYYRVYPLKDYTNELASNAAALASLDDPVAWLQEASREIIGDKIAIDDGSDA